MSSLASRVRKPTAIVVAVAAWFGMVLQFYVSAGLMRANGYGWLHIAIRYFSYFTVLTNALVAVTLTIPLLSPRSGVGRFFARPSLRAAVASYIAVVGISYSLLLRHVWDPKGLAKVSDSMQHDVVPVLYVLFWLLFEPKGTLRWRDLPLWLVYPLAYVAFAMIQGASSGFYPYYFIDAGKLGYAGALAGASRILVALLVLGLLMLGADRWMSRLQAKRTRSP